MYNKPSGKRLAAFGLTKRQLVQGIFSRMCINTNFAYSYMWK